MTRYIVTVVLSLAAFANLALAQKSPVELGGVKWERDLDRALESAEATGRDVFVLFQEVPG